VFKLVSFYVAALSLLSSAFAQTAQRTSAGVFARDPARFLNQLVRVDKLGCFFSPEAGYRCTAYNGLYVVAGEMSPPAIKHKIEAECGGIVEEEDDPGCLFDLVFTPLSVAKGQGQLVQGDRSVTGQVWMVQAATVRATAHP
jgi:hypothetical protein